MKKTYSKPETPLLKIQTDNIMISASPSVNDTSTITEPGEIGAKGNNFFDEEEEEDVWGYQPYDKFDGLDW